MKKIVSVAVAALLLVAVCGLSVAATSKSDLGELTKAVDGSGNDVAVTEAAVDAAVLLNEETALNVAHAASELTDVADPNKLTIVYQKDITATTTPITLTFTVSGKAAPTQLYVFHYTSGAWKLEGSGPAPTVTVTVGSVSPFAVVAVDQTTAPSTGDNSHVFLWGSLMVVAALGAVGLGIFAKRKKQ